MVAMANNDQSSSDRLNRNHEEAVRQEHERILVILERSLREESDPLPEVLQAHAQSVVRRTMPIQTNVSTGANVTRVAFPGPNHTVFVELRDDEDDSPEHKPATMERKIALNGLDSDSEGVVPEMCCPITCDVMQDPVMAVDGKLYEHNAIKRAWSVRGGPYSPLTMERLSSESLVPCHAMRKMIEALALKRKEKTTLSRSVIGKKQVARRAVGQFTGRKFIATKNLNTGK